MQLHVLKVVEYGVLPYLFSELSIYETNYKFKQTVSRIAVTCTFAVVVLLSGVIPILTICYNLNTLQLTNWIFLLELLLEWGCALLTYFTFFVYRNRITSYLNKTINVGDRIVFYHENRAHLSRTVMGWLVKLAIIILFHLLLTITATNAIPDQWLANSLISWSYRMALFCSSFILLTFVRSLELFMLFASRIKHDLYVNLNKAIVQQDQHFDHHKTVRLIQSDVELNNLIVESFSQLNFVISSVLFYYFFGTVSDSYELFVGLMEVYNAIRYDHILNVTVVLRNSLKLLLRYADIHSLIYGFNKFHQKQIHSAFTLCKNILSVQRLGINFCRVHEIVIMHTMANVSCINISGVILLNNSLLFQLTCSTTSFIVLLMQIKLSEEL